MSKRKENSTNRLNEKCITESCDYIYAICRIGGRWKMTILYHLKNRTLRFGELKKEITSITERMLTLQLKELEKDGLVKRTLYAAVPPKVEYALTPIACELIPIWDQLELWGARHKQIVQVSSKEV